MCAFSSRIREEHSVWPQRSCSEGQPTKPAAVSVTILGEGEGWEASCILCIELGVSLHAPRRLCSFRLFPCQTLLGAHTSKLTRLCCLRSRKAASQASQASKVRFALPSFSEKDTALLVPPSKATAGTEPWISGKGQSLEISRPFPIRHIHRCFVALSHHDSIKMKNEP